jgi:hypothetical protein
MSGSLGTGAPLTFRCAKCKTKGSWRDYERGTNWEPTGLIRDKRKKGAGLPRIDQNQQAQYRCLDCGHVGWSRHESVVQHAKANAPKRAKSRR